MARRRFTKEFKLSVIRELDAGKPLGEVARRYEIDPTIVGRWRRLFKREGEQTFVPKRQRRTPESQVAELERMIGRLTMENDLLKKALERLEAQRRPRTAITGNGSTD